VREAIFSLIGQDLTGSQVLDLFGGTGALGIEALSRGAKWVLFVDHASQALRLIEKNLFLCGYEGAGYVLKGDLSRGVPRHDLLQAEHVNLVFMDPPYGTDLVLPLLGELIDRDIPDPGATIVVETSKSETLGPLADGLQINKSRTYGDTRIYILEYGGSQ
jgi:16S rRNA (guanine966-N2)-methyltransferase